MIISHMENMKQISRGEQKRKKGDKKITEITRLEKR